jgi:hypothetical protein
MSMIAHALDYAARGWQVFPLKQRTKLPATGRGFYDATTNPETLRRWFREFPYNIGIRTGIASGVFAVDVDGNQGAVSLHEIETKHGSLPPTLVSTTGKGRHFWFKTTSPISCSTSKIGDGIDVRGDGGYVVAPPSVHPNGAVYRWVDDSIPPATAPDWLIDLARARPKISERALASIVPLSPRSGPTQAYGRAALDREVEELRRIPSGSRNHALNNAAFNLFQLVAGGELSEAEVVNNLLRACEANKLIADDGLPSVQMTLRSARAGLAHPRNRRGRA